jgi:hypothetical protein
MQHICIFVIYMQDTMLLHRVDCKTSINNRTVEILVHCCTSLRIFLYSSLGEDTIGDRGVAGNRDEEVDIGSWTTVLVETEIGLPSNCSMIAPRISVSSFLNSASSTATPSSALAILNAPFTTASTCVLYSEIM